MPSLILHPSSFARRRAFTLTELMISVAIALLLLIGINQVFKSTSQTVGTTYATLEGTRKQLAIDTALTPDIDKAVTNTEQPFILIHSESLTQYWDANDANSDKDNDVTTVDLDGNGTEGETTVLGEQAAPADLNSGRVHRVDRFSFFARDVANPFHRQTGDVTKLAGDTGDRLVSDETSSEAFIWYGFLRLPSNGSVLNPTLYNGPGTGDYFTPGLATAQINPNNFYAKDFSLGREVILLKSAPAGDHIDIDVNGVMGTKPAIPPISGDSPAYSTTPSVAPINNPLGTSPWLMAHSRFDIAKTTITDFRKTMAAIDTVEPNPSYPGTLCRTTWHISDPTDLTTPLTAHGNLDYQFNGKPWADPQGDRPTELATTTPFLTRGCSQFIVEWAGDYLTQDNNPASATYGFVTGIGPDGVLDYVTKFDTSFPPRVMPITRWYGFPRNVDTTDDIPPAAPKLPRIIGKTNDPRFLVDVVPLRDVIAAALTFNPNISIDPDYLYDDPSVYGRIFPGKNYPGKKCPERYVPPICTNYADRSPTSNPPGNGLNANSLTGPIDTATGKPVYVAAWGPAALTAPDVTSSTSSSTAGVYPGPWLVRVIINVRDPNGRLPDGQTVEHVYSFHK